MKFRGKPVVIDAFQWSGDINQTEDPFWIINALKNFDAHFINLGTEEVKLVIKNPDGDMIANRGDYIIRGINGEIYPCKPDIFYKMYDLVCDRRAI